MAYKSHHAFTIVELLVVIVVIGILAAITIVSYTGISQKAVASSLQSDLNQASKQLEMFYIDNSTYPSTISSNCTTNPTTNTPPTNLCLKSSGSNQFTDYSPNNTTNPPSYSLAAKNNTTIYTITNNTQPAVLSPAPLNPVADWLATTQGNHYGNFYDLVTKQYATVTRSTPKTIYDPNTQKIYDVPANYLAINPRSDGKRGSEAVIEEGRTNYLLNSYFSADTNSDGMGDSWSFNSDKSTNVYSMNITSSPYGNIQKVKASHISGQATGYPGLMQYTVSGTFAPTEPVSASFLYRNFSKQGNNVNLHLKPIRADGTQIAGVAISVPLTSSSNWQRITVNILSLPAETARTAFSLQQTQITDGDFFEVEIASAQIEKGSFATSYIPTKTTTASRNPDSVTISTAGLNPSNGTIFMAQKIGQNAVYGFLGGTSGSGANNFIFDYQPTGSLGRFRFNGADGNFVGVGSAVYSLNQNYVISGRWSESQVWYSVDGVSTSPVSTDAMTSVPSPYVLHYTPRADTYNRIIFYPTTLSGADVTTVTNAIKDGP